MEGKGFIRFKADQIGTVVAMATYSSHRLIMGKPSIIFFSEPMRLRAYINLYVAMFSGPLHKSCQLSPWGSHPVRS